MGGESHTHAVSLEFERYRGKSIRTGKLVAAAKTLGALKRENDKLGTIRH